MGVAHGRTLTAGSAYPPWHQATVAAQRFGDRLSDATAAKVKVVVQHSGALGLERELAQRVQLGTLDLTPVTTAALAALVPEMSVFRLPYLFRNYPHLFAAIHDGPLRQYCERALDRKGFRLVALVGTGYRSISGHVPINAPADFRGRKIRVQEDSGMAPIFEALGAVPTALPLPEVTAALRTRAVDLAEGDAVGFSHGKLYDIVKHFTDLRHLHQVAALVMSKTAWGKYDAPTQKAIADAGRFAEEESRKSLLVEDNALKVQLGSNAVTITRPDPAPFREATKRLYDEFYASPTGRDARKTVELILGLR